MEISCNSSSFCDKLQSLAVSSLFWTCQLCDLSSIVHRWWSEFLLWVLFKCICCCCVNFRRWEGSLLVFVRWVPGGVSMNSIDWRRECCLPFPNKCRPFRRHSRIWQTQSEKRVSQPPHPQLMLMRCCDSYSFMSFSLYHVRDHHLRVLKIPVHFNRL